MSLPPLKPSVEMSRRKTIHAGEIIGDTSNDPVTNNVGRVGGDHTQKAPDTSVKRDRDYTKMMSYAVIVYRFLLFLGYFVVSLVILFTIQQEGSKKCFVRQSYMSRTIASFASDNMYTSTHILRHPPRSRSEVVAGYAMPYKQMVSDVGAFPVVVRYPAEHSSFWPLEVQSGADLEMFFRSGLGVSFDQTIDGLLEGSGMGAEGLPGLFSAGHNLTLPHYYPIIKNLYMFRDRSSTAAAGASPPTPKPKEETSEIKAELFGDRHYYYLPGSIQASSGGAFDAGVYFVHKDGMMISPSVPGMDSPTNFLTSLKARTMMMMMMMSASSDGSERILPNIGRCVEPIDRGKGAPDVSRWVRDVADISMNSHLRGSCILTGQAATVDVSTNYKTSAVLFSSTNVLYVALVVTWVTASFSLFYLRSTDIIREENEHSPSVSLAPMEDKTGGGTDGDDVAASNDKKYEGDAGSYIDTVPYPHNAGATFPPQTTTTQESEEAKKVRMNKWEIARYIIASVLVIWHGILFFMAFFYMSPTSESRVPLNNALASLVIISAAAAVQMRHVSSEMKDDSEEVQAAVETGQFVDAAPSVPDAPAEPIDFPHHPGESPSYVPTYYPPENDVKSRMVTSQSFGSTSMTPGLSMPRVRYMKLNTRDIEQGGGVGGSRRFYTSADPPSEASSSGTFKQGTKLTPLSFVEQFHMSTSIRKIDEDGTLRVLEYAITTPALTASVVAAVSPSASAQAIALVYFSTLSFYLVCVASVKFKSFYLFVSTKRADKGETLAPIFRHAGVVISFLIFLTSLNSLYIVFSYALAHAGSSKPDQGLSASIWIMGICQLAFTFIFAYHALAVSVANMAGKKVEGNDSKGQTFLQRAKEYIEKNHSVGWGTITLFATINFIVKFVVPILVLNSAKGDMFPQQSCDFWVNTQGKLAGI